MYFFFTFYDQSNIKESSSATLFPYVFICLTGEIYNAEVLSTHDYELEANYFISALTLNIYGL